MIIGIVGAGTMGRRIAFGCVVRGVTARLYDVASGAAQAAREDVRRLVAERVNDGRLVQGDTERAMGLLSAVSSLEACVGGAQIVIETVPESVEIKRTVFAAIDRHLERDAILGTNSSSIPGSWLADATRCPERVFNVNFGGPDHLKVEVMGHPGTDASTIDRALTFVRDIGLIPILVRGESQGYATNRVWRAIKKEVLALLEGGLVSAEDIDRGWMLDWHTSIGPCGLMDKIGLDVVRDIELIYFRATGDPSDKPPPFLLAMIERGDLGVKSGRGFYEYPHPAYERLGWLERGSRVAGRG